MTTLAWVSWDRFNAVCAERDLLRDELKDARRERGKALALVREMRDVLDSLNNLDPTYGEVDVVLTRARALLGEETT